MLLLSNVNVNYDMYVIVLTEYSNLGLFGEEDYSNIKLKHKGKVCTEAQYFKAIWQQKSTLKVLAHQPYRLNAGNRQLECDSFVTTQSSTLSSSICRGPHGSRSHSTLFTTASPSIALSSMADSAEEPLMQHEHGPEEEPSQDVDLSDVSLLLEKNLRHPGYFVWLLTLSAGISGLLFGCEILLFSSITEANTNR